MEINPENKVTYVPVILTRSGYNSQFLCINIDTLIEHNFNIFVFSEKHKGLKLYNIYKNNKLSQQKFDADKSIVMHKAS